MDYKLIAIIKEKSTNTILYTIERESDKVLRDIGEKLLRKSVNEIDNIELINEQLIFSKDVKRISVNNMNNTGGKLVEGLNDLDTYDCMKISYKNKVYQR